MRERVKDIERLKHMQNTISRMYMSLNKHSKAKINEDPMLYYGLVKMIEIIGEAAYMLTNEFRDSHPDTPWKIIIAMRHVLVHGYYQIDEDEVWTVFDNDIPALKTQIEQYIQELENDTTDNKHPYDYCRI